MAVNDIRASQGRSAWVDAAKGIGIILVVAGHVLRGLATAGLAAWTPLYQFIDSWLYSFHMPLFFFVSGLFLAQSSARPLGTFVCDKVRTLAYPYFLWSLITLLLKTGLGGLPNRPRDISETPQILFSPIEQYWFLYALFFLSIGAGLAIKLRATPLILLGLAILINPAISPQTGWGIMDLTRSYAVYIVLGVCFAATIPLRSLDKIPRPTLIALGVAALFGAALMVGFGMGEWSELRPVIGVTGIAGVLALAIAARNNALLEILGRYALPIFVAHSFASAGTRIALQALHVYSPAFHVLFGTVVGLYMPLGLARVCERLGVRFAFTWPVNPTRGRRRLE